MKKPVVLAVLVSALAVIGCTTPGASRPQAPDAATATAEPGRQHFVIVTWNVRGYPDKPAASDTRPATPADTEPTPRQWFSQQLRALAGDVVCVQEIGNREDVDAFCGAEGYPKVAFVDHQAEGRDNAIFAEAHVEMRDIRDPRGFQQPAQAAYVAYGGFDAVVVTVRLARTDRAAREKEKTLLKAVVAEMLKLDPDVIVCGDLNTTEEGIADFAREIGMRVMVPEGQDGVATTYPRKPGRTGNRYDHFLVSPDLATEEAVGCRIVLAEDSEVHIVRKVSDHKPVQAWFKTDRKYRDRE